MRDREDNKKKWPALYIFLSLKLQYHRALKKIKINRRRSRRRRKQKRRREKVFVENDRLGATHGNTMRAIQWGWGGGGSGLGGQWVGGGAGSEGSGEHAALISQ